MALGYLVDPFIQIQNDNGTPIVGSKIYVYNADTTNLAVTYNDFEGHLNSNPILTDTLGNATIIADDGIEYDISVHDENDVLLFTKKYVSVDKTSSAGGNTQVVAGYGVTVNRVGNTFTVSVDTDLIATKDDLADKQDKLTGGANIEITNDNVVNVVQRKELLVQEPLKVNRSNNKITLYVDPDYLGSYKSLQDEVIIGGGSVNYISKITQNENGNVSADVGNFVAGSNINISNANSNLTISGKDWTSEINGRIGKVTGGAGSEVNPVYLDSSNIVTPCFSGDSVKFAASATPDYFAGDLAGNTFIYNVKNTASTSAYSIRNSVIVGDYDNFRHSSSSREHFDECIFMGGCYMYGGTDGETSLSKNIILGSNSISFAAADSNNNTVIGADNDIMCNGLGKSDSNTIVGYQNNIWGASQQCTMYGSNNDINLEHSSFSGSQVSIFGYNNRWQPKSNSVYDGIIVGNYNNVAQSGNYRTMAVGFSNAITGNCTTLIGSDLSANNEGSWEDQVMKVGFGACHLEIHSNGIIYKVVNGTKTQI